MAEEPTIVRKSRKRTKYPLHWAVIPIVLLVLVAWGWRGLLNRPKEDSFVLTGYVTSSEVFEQENARYYGPTVKNVDAEEKFQLAAESMAKHDYSGAAALLEEAAKQAALPVIFNDLGVLYARMDDSVRTVSAFREALARDAGYGPARQNLARIKGLPALNTAYPVTREIEPNDTLDAANLIALDSPADGEIASASDVDWYRVSSPAPPRDLLQIQVTNKSKSLALALSACDVSVSPLGPGRRAEPGASVTVTYSPAPNSAVYIKVEGIGGSTGPYTLAVSALKAFDAYEPNDQIFSASKIATGQPVEANIMDAQDTDFYSFVSPRTGTVRIEIQNRSTSLIPAIETFTTDTRHSGFGPDVTNPGAGLQHTMPVKENEVYYVRVWSHSDTAGGYTLIIH